METHLRLVLFLVGSVILALVIWDMLRQRRLRAQQDELLEAEQLDDLEEVKSSSQQILDFDDPEDQQQPWDNLRDTKASQTTQTLQSSAYRPLNLNTDPDKLSVQADLDEDLEDLDDSDIAMPVRTSLKPTSTGAKTSTVVKPQIQANISESPELQDMFAVYVMARDPKGFEGVKLKRIFDSANLVYGKMNIFHRFDPNNANKILFSVASAKEPGYFDLNKLASQYIVGVTIFMLPRQVLDPARAFDALVRTAKQLAFGLNGELKDQHHLPLTLHTIANQKMQLKRYAARYRS